VILRLAKQYFFELGNRGKVISPDYFLDSVVENQSEEQILFQHDSDSQIQLQICFRSLSYNDPDYYIACMISRIFDDGFTSRLQRELREDRGLVYSVECRATSLSDVGTMDFDVSVRPEKLTETCRILLDEIKKIAETCPTEEELAHFKQRYLFDFESDLDDPYKQVVRYAFPLLYSETITVEEEVAIIEAITTNDILEVAKKIFVKKKLNVVVVGPYTPANKSELEEIVRSF
jgi:predicted Zn-dependent peptidase